MLPPSSLTRNPSKQKRSASCAELWVIGRNDATTLRVSRYRLFGNTETPARRKLKRCFRLVELYRSERKAEGARRRVMGYPLSLPERRMRNSSRGELHLSMIERDRFGPTDEGQP